MTINPYHIRMSPPCEGLVLLSYGDVGVAVPAERVALHTEPMMGDNRAEVHTFTVEALKGVLAKANG